ncbi:MAG TPA: hypothetical protein V6C85_38920 [Allocoleopsis sp.]
MCFIIAPSEGWNSLTDYNLLDRTVSLPEYLFSIKVYDQGAIAA